MEISRREFVRHLVYGGLGVLTAGMLLSWLGCRAEEKPVLPKVPAPAPEPVPPPPASLPPPTPPVSPPPPPAAPTVAPSLTQPIPGSVYLAVARGQSPSALVGAAVKALGGIERFVKTGNDVIIKPNICTAYHPYEYATTTNPEVVASLVRLCLGAGAKRVRVMDLPFGGTPEAAYSRCGIAQAVQEAGGEMTLMSRLKYRDTPIPDGRDIKTWPIYSDILDTDVLINVPIAKHHFLARLTLGMKNLMGVVLERNKFHINLHQRIADLNTVVRPALTVIDAVRILINHGPSGGSLDDVKLTNTVIASQDIVAADAFATTLFGLSGSDVPALRAGAQMGLGTLDLSRIRVEEINVGD